MTPNGERTMAGQSKVYVIEWRADSRAPWRLAAEAGAFMNRYDAGGAASGLRRSAPITVRLRCLTVCATPTGA